jgi:hypothetical protein
MVRERRLGSFGNRGNGRYRGELRKGLAAITRYLTVHQLPPAHVLLRLDGQYGTGAVLSDLVGFSFVTRGKEYSVLDHPLVQAAHASAPDQVQQRRKVRSSAVSTTVRKCRWDLKGCCAV